MTQSISEVWINENYDNLKRIAKKLSPENSEDALHYALISFLEKKNLNDIIESGGGTFYIINILLRALRSKNNEFYKFSSKLDIELLNKRFIELKESGFKKMRIYEELALETGFSITYLSKLKFTNRNL
jgi:hypothetical protein